MVKALLAAILAALVALIVVLLTITRSDRHPASVAVNDGAPPASSFVVHNDPPPGQPTTSPVPPAAVQTTPAPVPGDTLDAVMQRLRSAKPDATVTVTPAAPGSSAAPAPAASLPPTATPAPVAPPAQAVPPAAPSTPATLAPAAIPDVIAPPPAPPPNRWTNVTDQGVQFRVGRAADGYAIAIDLGGGQVADVRVLPAFGRLDPAGVNARVDYLKQTILENFAPGSASYLFNRDGSVTRAR